MPIVAPYAIHAPVSTWSTGLSGSADSRVPGAMVRIVSTSPTDVRAEFARLSREWKRAVSLMSLSSDRVNDPSFARLVSMGDRVVPVLIEELKLGRYVWLELLTKIVGENGPRLSEDDVSSRTSVAEAWIEWDQLKRI